MCGFFNRHGVSLPRGTSWIFVWVFQPRRSEFTARYELNICLAFPTDTECVYCAVRAEYLSGFSNRDGVCLLRGTSWIFVWLFQPRRSVFTARYELNICVAFPTDTECVYCAVRAEYLSGFSNRYSVFTARYELNICLGFPTETECVYCAVRTGYLCGFSNRDGVCLLSGTSWIFVWLFQPRRSVFTARYEPNVHNIIRINTSVTVVPS